MYLAVVLDLFSRKVIGWHLSNAPETALILAALNQAVILRKITPNNSPELPNTPDPQTLAAMDSEARAASPG